MTIDSIYSLIMSMKQFRSIQSSMAKLLVQMDYRIYTENTLDSIDNDMRKLFSFDTNTSYRFRTLDQLNDLSSIINVSKFNLSNGLQYYLQTYRKFWIYLDFAER